MNFFSRKATKKNSFFSRPCLEGLEIRLVPAGEFLLHSNPGATKRIYLDFDGHTTTGTAWNIDNGATIISPAYDIDNNTSSFSATELANIREIWERVREDFLPFNVDVTTQNPGIEALRKVGSSDTEWGIRVAIGGFSSVLPVDGPGAVGIAHFDSFSSNIDDPCFVFSKEYTSSSSNAFANKDQSGKPSPVLVSQPR
jgi:hypothetical protein